MARFEYQIMQEKICNSLIINSKSRVSNSPIVNGRDDEPMGYIN